MMTVVEPFIAQLLQLERQEIAFAESVLSGQADVAQICPNDPAMSARIDSHPALIWKLQNVRQHRAKQEK